jgi:hypothetical protein
MQSAPVSLDCTDDADSAALNARTPEVQQFVGQSRKPLSDLSDEELNAYILSCAEGFLAAHKRWEAFGNFADCGERDAFWNAEKEALVERGCRPGVVARMEAERNLA